MSPGRQRPELILRLFFAKCVRVGSVQWSLTLVVAHLGGSLQQPGVEVEHVSGVSLTAGGTPQQQGHLTVGDSLLGQIVEDDEGVHAVVTEELTHGASRVGSQVLQWSSIGGGGRNNNTKNKDRVKSWQA